jgi:acetyl esterase/lipase
LEKSIGFRPTLDLHALPIPEIRENTRKNAALTDEKYPPPVVPGLESKDREIPTKDGQKITLRIYQSKETKQKKAPVVILYAAFRRC